MPDLTPAQWAGLAAVAVVIAGWLAASLAHRPVVQQRAARVGALGLYLALASLFTHLFLRARAEESTGGMVGFGILLALFGAGVGVSAVKLVAAFRRPAAPPSHATH